VLSHPYDALSVRTLRAAMIVTASAWGLLTLVLVWAVPIADIAELRRLLEVEPAARSSVLQSWEPSVVASICFLLGFDFLYDVVHNNAVAFFVLWGANRRDTPSARAAGTAVAWVLWLDTGLNVFENLACLEVLRSRNPDPLLPVVSAIFSFRSATLLLGVVVGIALQWSAWHASRLRRRPSGRV
jgi:hypothetical protein